MVEHILNVKTESSSSSDSEDKGIKVKEPRRNKMKEFLKKRLLIAWHFLTILS